MSTKHKFVKMAGLLVVAAMLFAALPVGEVRAQSTITVCASGCNYTSIQAAIDAAGDGATIEVSPGTYVEGESGEAQALVLDVPNLTVKSTGGRDVTTIDAGGATTAVWVIANLGDVTFDGFTVENFADNGIVQSRTQRDGTAFHILYNLVVSSDGYLRNGLQVSGDGSTVIGNIVYGAPLTADWASTGIGVVDAYNAIVRDNIVDQNEGEGTFPDIGINVMSYDYETSNITVENNVVSNAGDGVRISAVDRESPTPPAVKNVTITGNTLSDNTWGINVQKAVLDDVTITNNTIQSNHDDLLDDDGPLYGTGIRFADESATVTNASISGNTFSDNETYQVFGHTGALIDVSAVLSANTFDNAVTSDSDYVIYSSIQDAIDAASAGDTINVAAGEYVEEGQIVIDKNLTIVGEDKATTIIKPAQDTGDSGDLRGWFLVNAGVEFNLSNVTLDGGGRAIYQAIRSNGTGTITNNIIMNMEYTSGSYMGYGVAMMGGDMTISNNTLSNIGRVGIVAYGDGVDNGQITGNTYTGKGDGDWLDYGIEVGGGAVVTITGNTISNIGESTTDYSSAAILVTDAYPTNGPASVIITDNTLSNNYQGISVGYEDSDGVIVQAEQNDFSGTRYAINTTDLVQLVDGSPNWWGSAAGPAARQIIGDVVYSPWCGDAECSFLVTGVTPVEGDPVESGTALAGVLDVAQVGATIYVPEAAYTVTGGFVLNKPGVTLILGDGVTIQNNSPCFTVNASNTTVTSETVGGAVCKPTEGSPGVVVGTGLTNIVIEGFVIDGSEDTGGNHGILFEGAAVTDAVTDVIVRDILFRNLTGNAIHFETAPLGYVEIKGNLFMQEGFAVNVGDLDVEFNSWGSMDGPAADDLPAGYNVINWTHVDVYVSDGVGSRYLNEIALGDATAETITYNVYANLQNAFGAQFTLTFDPEKLQVTDTDTTSTVFPAEWTDGDTETVAPGVTVDAVNGKITFAGGAMSAVSGTDQFLFSVTFTGLDDTPDPNPLSFATTDEALFAMNPGYGSSLNIYAAGMAGVADVNVYDLPTLSISPLVDFAVGNPKEFTLTVSNPETGRAYDNLNVDLSGLEATLEYWDVDSWEPYTQESNLNTGRPLNVNDSATVDFRITSNAAGTDTATVNVYDGAISLVSDTFDFTVLASYTVTGSVQMQGRTVRDGVLVELVHSGLDYAYDMLSTSLITGNVDFTAVAQGGYTISFTQDRYLDATFGLLVDAVEDWGRLELKGGDLNNDEAVALGDASMVGTDYGKTGDNDGDANFDERVNIFDLAMVGGNYGLQSYDAEEDTFAYAGWVPVGP